MKSILGVIGIAGVLMLSGCSEEISKEKYTTIIGKPISVALGVGDSTGTIAVVLEEVGNKFILTAGYEYNRYITKAAALIQSEIAKGNEGQVELRGYYTKEGEFVIKAVKANGLSVEF